MNPFLVGIAQRKPLAPLNLVIVACHFIDNYRYLLRKV